MYAPFFGLSKEPFSIAPDPRFLFMSEQHREALAHLMYGLGGGGGFVLLTGEIGAGKTTVCRCFLEQVPASCAVAYIFNPKLTAAELLQTICAEFGITVPALARAPADPQPASVKTHVDALNAFLLAAHAQGRQAVLVIDEAQSLGPDVLEQLRLLTNLETSERKLLQIVLIGQPELRDMLAQPGLEQLSQRVTARFHLGALNFEETKQYLGHRLAVAGLKSNMPFNAAAVASIFGLSGGVPRRINLLADRALLGAYSQGQMQADKNTVAQAGREVFAQHQSDVYTTPKQTWWWLGAGATVVALAGAVGGWFWHAGQTTAPAVVAAQGTPVRKPGAAATASSSANIAANAAANTATNTATNNAANPAASPAVPAIPATPVAVAAAVAASAASAASGAATAADQDPGALLAAAQTQQATAWRELALRWNVAIGEGDPCVATLQAQLACFRSANGGLPMVRQLARPGILTLHAPGAAAGAGAASFKAKGSFALLVGLDDQNASLQVGRDNFKLSLPALAQIWRGEFATFWRVPTGWPVRADAPAGIAPGVLPAPTRAWVEQQMRAAGFAGDQPVRDRLRAYQLTQGLPADGLAGPLTLMLLSRAAGVEEPRLGPAR
jgi:general secretion pathway protein A